MTFYDSNNKEILDLGQLTDMRHQVQRMARICQCAEFLWNDMLPHDYEPFWTALGIALGKLDADGEIIG